MKRKPRRFFGNKVDLTEGSFERVQQIADATGTNISEAASRLIGLGFAALQNGENWTTRLEAERKTFTAQKARGKERELSQLAAADTARKPLRVEDNSRSATEKA